MFENLKQKMLGRIELNSIKVDVNGEKVYLKKSGLIKEWHVIYPPVNPETGKWDVTNLIFGGKSQAIKSFIVVVIVGLLAVGVYDVISSYNNILANPTVQQCLKTGGIILN